jgi:SPP1 gp7 family putative phage head morphogenesis protein
MSNGIYRNLNNQDYWVKRSEARDRSTWVKESTLEKELVRTYRTAGEAIKTLLAELYTKYGENNQLSYVDAIKALNPAELFDYHTRLQRTIQRLKGTVSEPLLLELDKLYNMQEVNRLQGTINQMQAELLEMGYMEQLTLEDSLYGQYEENYYHSIYDVQSGVGVGVRFNMLPKAAIRQAILTPWTGDMFSDNIWENKRNLTRNLRKTITNGLIKGEGYRVMAKNLNNDMNAGYKNALRIVRTETAHVVAEATGKGYESSGIVSQYIIIATLDKRTSGVCQTKDNKVYKLAERQVGVNYPPFHPNCRTTVAAYFDDTDLSTVERIARGEDGKNYFIPANISYKEWYATYVHKDL